MSGLTGKERSEFAEIRKQTVIAVNQLNRARAELEAVVEDARETVKKSRRLRKSLKKAEQENRKVY